MFKFINNLFSSYKKNPEIKIDTTIVVDDELNPAREMLKEATILKKEKKYEEACNKLKDAFAAQGSGDLMVKERMRLAIYLQLAKKNDEGWKVLNELNVKYTDVFSQAEIANQMRVFLQKEKKYTQALLFSVWGICKEVERDRSNIQGSIELTDEMASNARAYSFPGEDKKQEVYGKTPQGNPITDSAYRMFSDRIKKSVSKDGVSDRIQPLLKKAKKEELLEAISTVVSEYLKSTENYDLRDIRDSINELLSRKETAV